MEKPFCSIVITAYNSAGDLPGCLEGLLAQDYPNFEIILVNNASQDETGEIAARYTGRIQYVDLPVNRAVTGGYNAGAAVAKGEILVFINADTVPQPNWLPALVEPLVQDTHVGLTTSRILLFDSPTRINTCGNDMTWTGLTVCRGFGEPAVNWETATEVVAVSGAAFAIRRSLFETIGGFDETFEFYLDDTDISLRSLLAGYQAWYVPESQILHKYTFKFSPSKAYYLERNRWLTMFKLLRVPTLFVLLPGLILGDLMAWVYAGLQGGAHVRAKWNSWIWLWTNRQIVWRLRQKTQAFRKVPDRELLRVLSSELRFTGTVPVQLARLLEGAMRPILHAYGGLCRLVTTW
jgi:GT2 family glycosyltransferase